MSHEFHIAALGSGSDYTPFLQHLGVAALDMRFAAEDSGVYHSDYDDFNWFSHFSDTTFVYGRTLSAGAHYGADALRGFARCCRSSSGALCPPSAATPKRSTDLPSQSSKPDLAALRSEIARLQKTAADFDAAYTRALPNLGSAPPAKLAALNGILFHTERALTADPGLPGRPWYRHRIYAPGVYTGYAAKTCPESAKPSRQGSPTKRASRPRALSRCLSALNDRIAQATAILSQL